MKRNEFMEIATEIIEEEKYRETEPEYKSLIEERPIEQHPIPDVRPAGDSWVLASDRNLVMGIDWASTATETRAIFPTRNYNEADPDYVERCLRFILDNSDLANSYVRRALYQTLSQLADMPRENVPPTGQPIGPY